MMGVPRGVPGRKVGSEPLLSPAPPQALLQEVRTLRDRLCTEDEASSCTTAERLLQVYRQLRSPSLLLV